MCYSNYIGLDSNETSSESGLYITDLLGVTIHQLDSLTKEDQNDYLAFFEGLKKTAWRNLRIDTQKKLGNKFLIDKKLLTRETSEFTTSLNVNSGLAGVKIQVDLPKYARLQILSITVKSDQAYTSPEAEFYVYRTDENGELLSTFTKELSEGVNTVPVYTDYEEEELFIAYNPEVLTLYGSQNKYYSDYLKFTKDLSCTFPCLSGEEGYVQQVNAGGLNVKFVVYCSLDKFLCENINLFQNAYLYRLGVDLTRERIVSDNVNRFTVMTKERAEELLAIYLDDYNMALTAVIDTINIKEDPICFVCKSIVTSRINLP